MAEEKETLTRTKDNALIRVVQDKYDGRRRYEVLEAPDQPGTGDDQDVPRNLKNLEGRAATMNLESRIGKTTIITKENTSESQKGFYCETCECLMKDSNAWLDHVNGRKHNKLLGMNMKVERVGVDRVKERLSKLKKGGDDKPVESFEDFEKKYEDEIKRKAEKKLKDEGVKKKIKTENEKIEAQLKDEEAEIAETMGLPMSFGSSKRK